ncbi:MAG: DUF4230 domain-containing protein [Vicinamibacteria bacterium]|nr:DUF4230 domain-containing protein [Vicinamibacteria bacterium]
MNEALAGGGEPPKRKGTGGSWAVAIVFLTIACLVLPILLIRSTMKRVRSLGGAAESALIAVRKVAEGFQTGKVETTFRSYATELNTVAKFEFAELRQLESFERTDSASIGWGSIPLPDVVVEARGQVVYTYVLDFKKRWDLKLEGQRVEVTAPAPEFSAPALDPSTLRFETKRGSVLRNEETVRASLQDGLSALLNQRAREHLPLVRESGRKSTEDFVKNFLLSNYDDAAALTVRVRFADEPSETPAVPSLSMEGTPKK